MATLEVPHGDAFSLSAADARCRNPVWFMDGSMLAFAVGLGAFASSFWRCRA